ncbi:MAG: hypothetical protein HDR08_07965 [Lachnospiraceae bacterium]|nr:hypothetical protein [Lachnospiraceae bacterium]MBD5511173.1 hypothetical protein [Lachnospiraceae bacterium]
MKNVKGRIAKLLQRKQYFGLYAVVLLGISLIPLLIAGRYNVLAADDYAMSKESHLIWESTHSLWEMLKYAVQYTLKLYWTWKGSFTVSFFESLNPGAFGEKFACLTPVIMLFSILFSLAIFEKSVLSRYYTYTREEAAVLFGGAAFLILQTLPSPVEGLYWYSGALGYTFLHFLMLLLFAMVWKIEKAKNNLAKILYTLLACMYAFLVGGSQYITVLECLLWYAVLLFLERKNMRWWKIVPGISLALGSALNFLAPGNMARKAESAGLGPVKAILYSFVEALKCMKEWTTPMLVMVILFLLPFAWKIARKPQKKFMYRYPLVVIGFSYCLFSAAFTPSLYGVGNADSGRIRNLAQSVFYILLVVDLFYVIGYVQKKLDSAENGVWADVRVVKDIVRKYLWAYRWIAFAAVLLVWVGTGDKNTFSSVSALRSLANGEIRTYYAEAQERQEIYRDETITVAVAAPFSAKPKVLYFTDIVPEGDANYWINENIAAYYGKEKVLLGEPDK